MISINASLCLSGALSPGIPSTALCAPPLLQQRQAAVMALFLTGMINDGAHTANGPARLAFIRQGRRGERGAGRQTEVCVCVCVCVCSGEVS